ncbi:polyprenyl synthetase family protein [Klugiella xanthotipulae]
MDDFIDKRHTILADISADATPLITHSREFLRGGKRFRALFTYWSWQGITEISGTNSLPSAVAYPSEPEAVDPANSPNYSAILQVASALELFHAAALVHDDVIDNSDTRRGTPAAHLRFERLHRDGGWRGDPAEFGRASAILLGDLLQFWSDELFSDGIHELSDPAAARRARAHFNQMRTDVGVGQYLDLLEEHVWGEAAHEEQLERSTRVLVYKSAKYSVEAPLLIGAALGGASAAAETALSAFGLPLGVAFQLRDDLLGVFGDSAVTGKPSGDDLREGKQTVLIALARRTMPPAQQRAMDDLLGNATLDESQIVQLQNAIRESGAYESVEKMIEDNVERAQRALHAAPLGAESVRQLAALAHRVTQRVF